MAARAFLVRHGSSRNINGVAVEDGDNGAGEVGEAEIGR
jgi:hypothetical protein